MIRVELLSFPPPYKAALAISNDVDDLLEPEGWWHFLRYLNTTESTPFGQGLDLEIGDSFWFWSDDPAQQPGAYFQGLEETPSVFAPYIAALGRAGYLDTLHSWGRFSRHGGFRRRHAEIAAQVLADEGFAPRVWVNHGGGHDFQNLWSGCGDTPENPDAAGAPAPEYHLDLTWKLGFRYAWLGELTRVPGQDRSWQAVDWFGAEFQVPLEIGGYLGRLLSERVGYRHVVKQLPNYPTLRNSLLGDRRMRDGTRVRTFVRYGDFNRATFDDLAWLLRAPFLDRLEDSGGASVVFVHWARHHGRSFTNLNPSALAALAGLAGRVRDGRIWVTTTSRLLDYMEARKAIRVVGVEGGTVHLGAGPLPDGRSLEVADLAGLSFRWSGAPPNSFQFHGAPVAIEPVAGDPGAVWIPCPPLQFPAHPKGHS